MTPLTFLQLVLYTLTSNITFIVAAGAEGRFFGRSEVDDDHDCNVLHALHVLQSLSMTGESFCTSLLHTPKGATETKSFVATTTQDCSIRTVTTTEHGTFTTTIYGKATTLPQLTFTSYSSTVLVPSGPPRPINKRSNPTTPASLTTCPAATVTVACSSLLAPSTILTTSTSTHSEHKCLSTTTVTFTTTRHTVTSKIPFIVTPPPYSIPGTGVLTTTVPADCISGPYQAPVDNTPIGTIETFSDYPFQPGTAVECCVACHQSLNCIASAFDPDSDECAFLTLAMMVHGATSDICPLGIYDYAFGEPIPGDEVSPGPCGM